MVTYYTSALKVGYLMGITFSDEPATRPSATDITEMLVEADGIINAEAKVTTNMTDTYGELAIIATSLVMKMINNMWSFTHPEQFPFVEIELTDEQKRLIHKTHLKFAGKSWELGG